MLSEVGKDAGAIAAETVGTALNQAEADLSRNLADAVSVMAGAVQDLTQRIDRQATAWLQEVSAWRGEVSLWGGQFTRIVDFIETISIGRK